VLADLRNGQRANPGRPQLAVLQGRPPVSGSSSSGCSRAAPVGSLPRLEEAEWRAVWHGETARSSSSAARTSREGALRGQVEEVPEGLEGADMARIFSAVGWGVEKFGAPEMADRVAVAVEHVEHRPLDAVRGFGVVVAVVVVRGRGKRPEPSPPALLREREQPRQRCFRDDH